MKILRLLISLTFSVQSRGAAYVAASGSSSGASVQHALFLQSYVFSPQIRTEAFGSDPKDWPDKITPEGGINPFENTRDVEWAGESRLPWWLQYMLVFLWVFMLASIPFIIPWLDHRPVTNTHKALGGTMLVVLFGGFWLFTNIILFQSGHFKRIRPLTNVECIYFMAQVITTVGYGDVTPAKPRGQVFVGVYVLGALFIIAMLVSEMTTVIVSKAQSHMQTLRDHDPSTPRSERDPSLREYIFQPRPSAKPLLISLAVFAVIDIAWIMFFTLHPGEGKTLFQAIYMSVITLSTVGFGYFTPVTEVGMIFGAFMMFFGAGALGAVISNFTALMVQLNQWERVHKETGKTAVAALLKTQLNGANEVTELQFMRFLLLQCSAVSERDLNRISKLFRSLDPEKGKVALTTVEDILKNDDTLEK